MGRYDKIKVYHNGSWKTPTYCRVYKNGSWVDLGDTNSYSVKDLYVRKNNNYVRATLHRQDYTTVTDRWAEGSFNILPASGYCWCPKSSAGNYNFYFRATVTKTTSESRRLFYCGNGTRWIEIYWQADGKLRVDTHYNSTTSVTSSNAVGANTQTYVNVFSNSGSNTINIQFGGVTTQGTSYQCFKYSDCTNSVGDANIQFRGNVSICGVGYNTGVCYVSFDASYASGTDGSQYTGVQHRESSTTGTNWV